MNDIQHEQLFTDLTPEQAAVVEGGAYYLASIECLTASADPVGGDEPYINADGATIWSGSLEQGGTARIDKRISSDWISLYDDDAWPNPDDPIGVAFLDGSGTAFIGGGDGNSYYKLNYTVI